LALALTEVAVSVRRVPAAGASRRRKRVWRRRRAACPGVL